MNLPTDNKDNQVFFKECLEQLEKWYNYPTHEILASEIEKFMYKLDVKPIKGGHSKGSSRSYHHPALRDFLHYTSEGIFSIHVSGKKRHTITKYDFRKFLYRPLKEIIRVLGEI
ncbi:hypothetical protein AMJ80_04975 [bacterium SM23_31]|nr:MAG: hypothetical protein AMJ80_04975 [bacterium SM23_31]